MSYYFKIVSRNRGWSPFVYQNLNVYTLSIRYFQCTVIRIIPCERSEFVCWHVMCITSPLLANSPYSLLLYPIRQLCAKNAHHCMITSFYIPTIGIISFYGSGIDLLVVCITLCNGIVFTIIKKDYNNNKRNFVDNNSRPFLKWGQKIGFCTSRNNIKQAPSLQEASTSYE